MAAMRAQCSQIQSLPSCTGSDAAGERQHEADQQQRDPVGDDGASTISGTSTSTPRCWESSGGPAVNPPPPMTAAMTRPTGAGTQSSRSS